MSKKHKCEKCDDAINISTSQTENRGAWVCGWELSPPVFVVNYTKDKNGRLFLHNLPSIPYSMFCDKRPKFPVELILQRIKTDETKNL